MILLVLQGQTQYLQSVSCEVCCLVGASEFELLLWEGQLCGCSVHNSMDGVAEDVGNGFVVCRLVAVQKQVRDSVSDVSVVLS